jgi:hypothetical protein
LSSSRLHAPTGESHLTGPRVPLALGAANHQHAQLSLAQLQDQGHGGALHQRAQPLAGGAVLAETALGQLQKGDGHGATRIQCSSD